MSYTSPFRRYRAETKPKWGLWTTPPGPHFWPTSTKINRDLPLMDLYMLSNCHSSYNTLSLSVRALSRGNQIGQTDRRTDGQTDGEDIKIYRAAIAVRKCAKWALWRKKSFINKILVHLFQICSPINITVCSTFWCHPYVYIFIENIHIWFCYWIKAEESFYSCIGALYFYNKKSFW